jgi:hypothetical protein
MGIEVQTHLSEIGPVYEKARRLRARWEALQTVEQARAEYNELFSDDEEEIERWEARKAQLEREARRRAAAGRKGRSYLKGSGADHAPPMAPPPSPAPPPQRRSLTAARRRLQDQASRFQHWWRLDSATLARINRIADDVDRPLGEAIALLDWTAFQTRLRTPTVVYESESEHAERLGGWRRELDDYVKALEGDISALENTYGGWMMHVWDTWRERSAGAEGQARWDALIEQKRLSNAAKLDGLKKAVTALEEEAAGGEGGRRAAREEQP